MVRVVGVVWVVGVDGLDGLVGVVGVVRLVGVAVVGWDFEPISKNLCTVTVPILHLFKICSYYFCTKFK